MSYVEVSVERSVANDYNVDIVGYDEKGSVIFRIKPKVKVL